MRYAPFSLVQNKISQKESIAKYFVSLALILGQIKKPFDRQGAAGKILAAPYFIPEKIFSLPIICF